MSVQEYRFGSYASPSSAGGRSRPGDPPPAGRETPQRQDGQEGQEGAQPALSWARRRLAGRSPTGRGTSGRGVRRTSSATGRAEHRLEQLGPSWRVVEVPEPEREPAGARKLGRPGKDRESDPDAFLAIGPGGVYAVTVVDHGRHRVMLAGDVVQVQGRRPPYVAQARRKAKTASTALSNAVGTAVPVVPILTFVGSGAISAHGLPTGCLVVSHRELDRLLLAAGNKISVSTAQKLADVASRPGTWADRYRWYSDSQTASDKGSARR